MPLIMTSTLKCHVSGTRVWRWRSASRARMFSVDDAAGAAIAYVRRLNSELGIASLGELIQRRDAGVLAEKAAANTSAPSNPREARVEEFRVMFAAGLAS
jgi:alcohol dehydrogenase class IV